MTLQLKIYMLPRPCEVRPFKLTVASGTLPIAIPRQEAMSPCHCDGHESMPLRLAHCTWARNANHVSGHCKYILKPPCVCRQEEPPADDARCFQPIIQYKLKLQTVDDEYDEEISRCEKLQKAAEAHLAGCQTSVVRYASILGIPAPKP